MHPKAISETNKYNKRGHPGIRGTKTGGGKKILSNPLKRLLALIILNLRLFPPQKSEDRLTSICQSNNKLVDILQPTQETPDLSLGKWWRHVKDNFDLIRIRLNTSLTNHVAQELPRSHSKRALLGIQSQSKAYDPLEEAL